MVLLNSSTAIGSVVVYSCNKRMKMVGNKTLICREDSTWSSNPPVCERKFGIHYYFKSTCTCKSSRYSIMTVLHSNSM